MQNLILTANIVTPVFLIVVIGIVLKLMNLMNDNFVNLSSKIVFSISLPALIFIELSQTDFHRAFDPAEITFILSATVISFLLCWVVSALFIKDGRDKGTFIQGSFRSNYAIFGLAIIANMLGGRGLARGSLILAFIVPLYNVLSVIALTVPTRKERQRNLAGTFIEILKNPLIAAVIVAIPFSLYKIPIHPIILKTGEYLADIALPLALIGIGGSLNIKNIKSASGMAFTSTALKLIIIPLIFTYAAYEFGFKGETLAIMFILFASPTAIASFVMAEAMGGNGRLAGNIVMLSTLGSVITMTLGIYLLKSLGAI
jgi:hypothetical protein